MGRTRREPTPWAEIAASVLIAGVYVWLVLEAKEGGGNGLRWRLRWRAEQKRRAQAAELAYQADLNRMWFEVYDATGAL